MKRARRSAVRARQREQVEQREQLERRMRRRLESDPTLAVIVTAETAREEPHHRWIGYRQGFAPELVRRFLRQAGPVRGPVLDPFAGSGTVVIECARRGRAAAGVDVLPELAFLLRARFGRRPEPWPDLRLDDRLEDLWQGAGDAQRRAAVLLAALEGTDGLGRPRRTALRPAEHVARALRTMREDLGRPLRARGLAVAGDARALPFASATFGGLLTSPPYLSRYGYAAVNAAAMRLYRGRAPRRVPELRASSRNATGAVRGTHPAAEEAARLLEERDLRAARVVRAYHDDMERVLAEAFRVLRPGAPAWLVVGGADVKREYVPSDLIVAEQAEAAGFVLEGLVEARRLRPWGRHLGSLHAVAPRESLLRLRRP